MLKRFPNSSWTFYKIVLVIVFLTTASFATALPNLPVLRLQNENNIEVYATSIDPDCGFAISYTHSVALSPVTDYFSIRDNAIWLNKTIYHDFGAGLPHEPGAGQIMKSEKGQLIIDNFNRRFDQIPVRVGRIASHKLLLFNKDDSDQCLRIKTLPLKDFAKPGSVLLFKAN